MDKHIDNVLTGSASQSNTKIWYLQECDSAEKDALVDEHSFVLSATDNGYFLESKTNSSKGIQDDVTLYSYCVNNGETVKTDGNIENIHKISIASLESISKTFDRYYTKNNNLTGCKYSSIFETTLNDMFKCSNVGNKITVSSNNVDGVTITPEQLLSIEWYINNNVISKYSGMVEIEPNNDMLKTLTSKDTALMQVRVDGELLDFNVILDIDRTDYKILNVVFDNVINGLKVYTNVLTDATTSETSSVRLYMDDTGVEFIGGLEYDKNNEGKTVKAVIVEDGSNPVSPFTVGLDGIKYVKDFTFDTIDVSVPYIDNAYYTVSEDGIVSGLNKSETVPVEKVSGIAEIKNFSIAEANVFSEETSMKYSQDLFIDGDGVLKIREETGTLENYAVKSLFDSEMIFVDRQEVYSFTSRSDFENNPLWTIPNIDSLTFGIDNGSVSGDNMSMTFDSALDDISSFSCSVYWGESVTGSEFTITAIDENGTSFLQTKVINISASSSSLYYHQKSSLIGLASSRFNNFILLDDRVYKKIVVTSTNSNISISDIKVKTKRNQ